MKAERQIQTSGDLRAFLSNALLGIRNGDIDIHKASQITKMAAQINESIYSEIKAGVVLAAAGKTVAEFGNMPLSE